MAYDQRPGISVDIKKNVFPICETEELIQKESCESLAELPLQTVKVYLRLKPFSRNLNLTEQQKNAYRITDANTLITKLPILETPIDSMMKSSSVEQTCRRYTFTETFGPETTQLKFFEDVVKFQMSEFIKGQNCTIMTCGTLCSGKSYTLQGTIVSPGIIPRSLEFVFANINPKPSPCYKPIHNRDVIVLSSKDKDHELEQKNQLLTFNLTEKNKYIAAYKKMQKLLEESSIRVGQTSDAHYSVWISFAEIYNETIYDLLSNDCQKRHLPLKLATDSNGRTFIKGLKSIHVNSGSEAFQILMAGRYNLKVASTTLNSRSSRSHCIFTIKLLKCNEDNDPDSVEVSTFSFCDLAGSERLKKTLNVDDKLEKAQNINTSLLVLGRCLKSIHDGQSMKQRNEHVGPFRESNLTHLFQQALSGKEPIALIVNVNPSPNLYIETQNVLNFSAINKKIILQPLKTERRMSTTRFSQIVDHNTKDGTNWDDTDALDRIPDNSLIDPEQCPSVQSENYGELLDEDEKLRRELSVLNRKLEIRQDIANTYSKILKKFGNRNKNQLKNNEEQQEDLMEYDVNRVEVYWKEKLNQNTSRKRRRSEYDDDFEVEKVVNIAELEAENVSLTSKVTSLKEALKDSRKQKDLMMSKKNTAQYELSLVNNELKKANSLIASMQIDLTSNGESLQCVNELRNQVAEIDEKNKKLRKYLKEAEQDYINVKTENENKDRQIKEREYEIRIQSEKIRDLERDFENAYIVSIDRMKYIEQLEDKSDQQSEELINAEARIRELIGDVQKIDESSNKHENIMDEKLKTPDTQMASSQTVTAIESNTLIKMEKHEYCDSDCQTTSVIGIDQITQTSFIDTADENMNKELKMKDEQLSITEKELEKIKENYNELQQKFKDKQQNVTKLSEQLSDGEKIQEKLTVEIEEFKERVNKLNSTINLLRTSELAYTDIIEKLKNESDLNTLKCQTEHVDEIAKLKVDLSTAEQSREELTNKYHSEINKLKQDLSDKIQYKEERISKLDCELENLQKMKTELENKLQNNSHQIEEMNFENKNFVLMDKMIKNFEQLNDKVDRQSEQSINAEARIRELIENAQKIDEISDKHDNIINELKITLKFYKEENSSLSETLSQRSCEVELLKRDLDDSKVYLTNLNEKLKALYIQIASSQTVAAVQPNTIIKMENLEYCGSDCQTTSVLGTNQINQTTFIDTVVENINEELKIKDEKLSVTEKELGIIKENYNELQKKFKDEQQNVTKLSEQLSNREKIQGELMNEIEEHEKRVNELESRINGLQSLESSNLYIIEKLKNESDIHILKCQTEHVDEISKLKTDLSTAEQSREELTNTYHSEINKLKQDLSEKLLVTEKELGIMRENYNELQKKFKDEQQNVTKLSEQLNNREKIQGELMNEIEEHKKRVNELKNRINVLQLSESSNRNMIEKIKNESDINVLKCQTQYIDEIAKLKTDLSTAKQSRLDLTNTYHSEINKLKQDFSDKTQNKEKRISKLNFELENSQTRKAELENKLQMNLHQIEVKNYELQESTEKLQDKDKEISQLQNEIKTMLQSTIKDKNAIGRELEKVRNDLLSTKQIVESKTNTIEQLRCELTEYETLKKTVAEYEQQIAEIKKENDSLQKTLNSKDKNREKYKHNRDKLIEKYEKSLDTLEEELDRLKQENSEYKNLNNLLYTIVPSPKTTQRNAHKKEKFSVRSSSRNNSREIKLSGRKFECSDDEVAKRRAQSDSTVLPKTPDKDKNFKIQPSGSKLKRATLNTEKTGTTEKRPTQKKKLYTIPDDFFTDILPTASEPSPSPSTSS